MTTLREHLEAIRGAAIREPRRVEIAEHAVAALVILDTAVRDCDCGSPDCHGAGTLIDIDPPEREA